MSQLPALLSPVGIMLWLGWNFAVLSSIQLTVRLIRAFSIKATLFAAAAFTIGSLLITFMYVVALGSAITSYPLTMILTGLLGFVVADRMLRLKRLRGRVAAAFGTAILSSPWPVFFELLPH